MKPTILTRLGFAISVVSIIPGCVAAVGYAVGQADAERLKKRDLWEASLERLDCEQLTEAYDEMVAQEDDFVDFDQREDIMEDKMNAQNCPLPDGLS